MTDEGCEPGVPGAGGFAVDARDGRVGRVTGRSGPNVRLRPPGGGPEWDCPPEAVRPGVATGSGAAGPGDGDQQGGAAAALRPGRAGRCTRGGGAGPSSGSGPPPFGGVRRVT